MNIRTYLINTFFLPIRFEKVPRKRDFDFITPQAFGRNSYPEEGFHLRWRNKTRGLQGKLPVEGIKRVVEIHSQYTSDAEAFKKLKEEGFDPGEPNRILAELCWKAILGGGISFDEEGLLVVKQEGKNKPVIGQWEVMYAMWLRNPGAYSQCSLSHQALAIWPSKDGYLGRQGLLLEVKRIVDQRGLSLPCVVAHPEHIQRAYFLARKIFGKPVAKMTEVISDLWFDSKSVQLWTRGKWRWLFYEMLTRMHHRYYKWI